jgi:hypothetical protein
MGWSLPEFSTITQSLALHFPWKMLALAGRDDMGDFTTALS